MEVTFDPQTARPHDDLFPSSVFEARNTEHVPTEDVHDHPTPVASTTIADSKVAEDDQESATLTTNEDFWQIDNEFEGISQVNMAAQDRIICCLIVSC